MLTPHDQRDLILPIFTGIDETPLWRTCLLALLHRTRASQVALFARTAQMPPHTHLRRVVRADARLPEIDADTLGALGLLHHNSLRPGRVYALEELIDPGEGRHAQRRAMAAAGVAHGRFVHAVAREDHHIWLLLLHDRIDFGGADSALLSSLAEPLGVAFAMLASKDALRLRAAMAEAALDRLGIRQTPLDADGRPLAPPPPEPRDAAFVTHPLPQGAAGLTGSAVAVRLTRTPGPTNRKAAAGIIATELGISDREAALAEALSRGRTIIEAGADLQLTPETARNYTKRIYAKTGAQGQADLVRRVLTGLAPLA